ncbi:MAG: hypothetical protein QW343_00180 [Candidatus Norongarragalinales archaeon]
MTMFDAIETAIRLHTLNFAEAQGKLKRPGYTLEDKIVTFALIAADKGFEANGAHMMMLREPWFLIKERLRDGDLKHWRASPNQQAHLVLSLMQNYLRNAADNRFEDHPAWLQPLIKPLHEVNLCFQRALLHRLGLNEQRLVTAMLEHRFPRAETRRNELLSTAAHASSPTEQTTVEAVNAVVAVLQHFNQREFKTPLQALRSFKPPNAVAATWKRDALAYYKLSPAYFKRLRAALRESMRVHPPKLE